MSDSAIIPVILSGGSGTRLWPVSRESFPKQLWPLDLRPHPAPGDRAARPRRPLRPADRRLQPGAPLPDRRAAPRRRHRRRRASCWSRSAATAPRRSPPPPCWSRKTTRTPCCGCSPPTTRSPTQQRCTRASPSPPRRRAPAASSPSACARPRRRPATATSSIGAALDDAPGAYAVAQLHRKAGCRRRRPASSTDGTASVELRHVRVHRAHAARGVGRPTRPTC